MSSVNCGLWTIKVIIHQTFFTIACHISWKLSISKNTLTRPWNLVQPNSNKELVTGHGKTFSFCFLF